MGGVFSPQDKFAKCVATLSTAKSREWRVVQFSSSSPSGRRFLNPRQVRRMCGDVEHREIARMASGAVFFKFAEWAAFSQPTASAPRKSQEWRVVHRFLQVRRVGGVFSTHGKCAECVATLSTARSREWREVQVSSSSPSGRRFLNPRQVHRENR
jgi:hypothetical protein